MSYKTSDRDLVLAESDWAQKQPDRDIPHKNCWVAPPPASDHAAAPMDTDVATVSKDAEKVNLISLTSRRSMWLETESSESDRPRLLTGNTPAEGPRPPPGFLFPSQDVWILARMFLPYMLVPKQPSFVCVSRVLPPGVAMTTWRMQRVPLETGGCVYVWGGTIPSQTWGTQDKRSQSKGDVAVMKTKALRGRSAEKPRHFRPAPLGLAGPVSMETLPHAKTHPDDSPPSVHKWNRII